MVKFSSVIDQFAEKGEKSGWTYILIPSAIAQELKPSNKKTFRVKGKLDAFQVNGVAILPLGNGDFIMPLNAEMRKGIKKIKGASLHVQLEEDKDFKIEMPDDLHLCLADEPAATEWFNSLRPSHQAYFIKWINGAKTDHTRTKRIAHTVNALSKRWDYGQMIRNSRDQKP